MYERLKVLFHNVMGKSFITQSSVRAQSITCGTDILVPPPTPPAPATPQLYSPPTPTIPAHFILAKAARYIRFPDKAFWDHKYKEKRDRIFWDSFRDNCGWPAVLDRGYDAFFWHTPRENILVLSFGPYAIEFKCRGRRPDHFWVWREFDICDYLNKHPGFIEAFDDRVHEWIPREFRLAYYSQKSDAKQR